MGCAAVVCLAVCTEDVAVSVIRKFGVDAAVILVTPHSITDTRSGIK